MGDVRWDMALTAAVPLALLLVMGLVLLGNRSSAETRRRTELGLALLFYPFFSGFFVWKAFGEGRNGDWVTCAAWGLFALFIASNGVRVVRARLGVGRKREAVS